MGNGSQKRSQWKIFKEFLRINIKLRNTIGFWVLSCLAILFLSAITILKKYNSDNLFPYQPPRFYWPWEQNMTYYVSRFGNRLGIYPQNNFSMFFSDELLKKSNNRSVKYFNSVELLSNYVQKSENHILGLNFGNSLMNNQNNISLNILFEYGNYISEEGFFNFTFFKAIEFLGHTVNISALSCMIANPYKPGYFAEDFYSEFILISFFLVMIRSFLTLLEFKEQKIFLLLTISGAKEMVLWLSMLVYDLILIFGQVIILTFILSISKSTSPINFSFVFVFTLFNFIATYFFMMFITSFFSRAKSFKYIFIMFLSISILLPNICKSVIDTKTPKETIKTILNILPQFQTYMFYQNMMHSVYYNRTVTWNNMYNGFVIENYSVINSVFVTLSIYMLLTIVLNLMNSRRSGSPPIGWKNIFKIRYWKRLFSSSDSVLHLNESDPLIRVEEINKTYYGTYKTHAIDNVSFSVQKEEVIVLIGPNGSGKSTLLNSMTGTIECDSGELYISGKKAQTGFAEMQNYIGICFQENIFFPSLSVMDHLKFFGMIRTSNESFILSQIQMLTNSLGLSDSLNTKANNLSGGQKRKLCIAIAVIGNPPLVILDEPTAGIDASARQIIWKSISLMKDVSFIITSHSLEEAESVSSRIFVMKNGKLVFTGTSSELRRQYKCGYRCVFLGESINFESLCAYVHSLSEDMLIDPDHKNSILIPVDDTFVSILENIENHKPEFKIDSINVTAESLEHVLLRLIAEEENQLLKAF